MKAAIDDITSLLYTNFLIVGPPKTGKTQSCATLHKLRKRPWVKGTTLHVHDFDNGCQPIIRRATREGWANELRIFRYPRPLTEAKFKNTGTPDDATVRRSKENYLDFITYVNNIYDNPGDLNAPYAIVVDSLTVLSDHILGYVLALRGKDLGRPGVDGRQEYGLQMGKIVETIRSLRELPCFTIVLAHEQNEMETVGGTDPKNPMPTGRVYTLPLVTGKLAFSLGEEFGGVFHTAVENGKYQWIASPTANIRSAGTRLKEGLPARIDQDFDLIVE